MILPMGAKPILDARLRGQRPAEMLIVSLIGKTDELNHHVFANPAGDYDWRWIVGLDACIYVRPGVNWQAMAMQIARAKPRWLGLYDVDRFEGADVHAFPRIEDIDRPQAQWRWYLDFLPWTRYENQFYLEGACSSSRTR